ncbi:MAG: hypothetical protein AAFQ67_05235 [Pseudomonadota bacterium]
MHLYLIIILGLATWLVLASFARHGERRRMKRADHDVVDRLDDLSQRIGALETLATDRDRELRRRFRDL